jgi:hypothetical protein
MVSCSVVVAVSTWPVPFPYAPKKNSVQLSDFCGLKVYQGQKSIEDFHHKMGTVLYRSVVCMNGLPCPKNGRTSVTHDERSGRTSTSTTEETTERVRAMILDNRRVTVDEVTYHLLISHGSVHEITHNCLGFHKVCARRVPEQLAEQHKRNRLTICRSLFNRCRQEGDAFLRRIINRDETWIHHYAPESKRQSLEWKHPKSPAKKKKFKTQPSAGKVMLLILGGFTRANFGTVSRLGHNSKQCLLQ